MDTYKVYITGYIKGEPKIFNGQSTVASFTVASYKGKNKDGESMGYAYNDVKAFKGTADYIAERAHDGDYIVIEGTTEKSHFTGRDGNEVWQQEVKALNVKVFNMPKRESSGGSWK